MKHLRLLLMLPLLLLLACQPIRPEVAQSGADKIANAMSAGLHDIAHEAAILDWPTTPGSDLVELRQGNNGWTCLTDIPFTPTNDPLCVDTNGLTFIQAYLAGQQPDYTGIGLIYMLQGQSIASSSDPSLLEPAAGQDWALDGPHLMLVSSSDLDPDHYSTDHHAGGPYIMFEGTPLEHLMIPTVADVTPSTMDPIQNAMSAAPLRVAENATILDWPDTAGGNLVELRAGDNGWTCVTDLPFTPTDDPMCMDANGLEFLHAYLAGRAPEYTNVGIIYMLQGQSIASNSDPSLTEPPAGADWVIDGPHFMVVAPWKLDPALYSTDHDAGGPYTMFAGTPYEHLMVPVAEMKH